jgi:cell division protein FtsL
VKSLNAKWVFAVLMLCALATVYASYINRQLAQQWQIQSTQYAQLQEEYGRLMLEYSTLAAPSRVENMARQKLNMQFPDALNTRIIEVHDFLKK